MAINLDGIGVPEFPDAKPDNGIADNLKIEAVPALVAVNPKDNSIVPLANGYLSESGIEDRVDFLIEGRKRNKQMRMSWRYAKKRIDWNKKRKILN